MADVKLRDRDAIITKEGLIFRVFGNLHPLNAYICDLEYAPSEIFTSNNPKAFRNQGPWIFYKFYEDEGWNFLRNNYHQHLIFHETLQKDVVGVCHRNIVKVRRPPETLKKLFESNPRDELLRALQDVLNFTIQHSSLAVKNFGVFGSVLHGFQHPRLSDIDLTIYGQKNIKNLLETLREIYQEKNPRLQNEFETEEAIKGKRWRFRNYNPAEYVWHQRRKMIYAVYTDQKGNRRIKTEFEPVKDWKEISKEYDPETRIVKKGWVKMLARVVEDQCAPYIPSIYYIEPIKIINGPREAKKTRRIVSFMEEFRMQANKNEIIYVEGNLEEKITSKENFYQIALTYCSRYYDQVLKRADIS